MLQDIDLTGYFKKYYKLSGRDWLRTVSKEDRAALAHIGFAASGYGVVGGLKRAATAKRDAKGRFTK